jgi:hypothetical protein
VATPYTRRGLFQSIVAGLFSLSVAPPATGGTAAFRRYRIDVTIAPFGIPIFSRREVGYGVGRLQVSRTDSGDQFRFEFGGASIPERAHGLRQIGFFEEHLERGPRGLESSRYFGFLSSAPEGPPSRQTLANAKHDSQGTQKCCVVEGEIGAGEARFAKSYEATLPPEAGLLNIPELRKSLRQSLTQLCQRSCLAGTSPAKAPHSFLSTLLDASESPGPGIQRQYIYGDRLLSFTSQRRETNGEWQIEAQVKGKSRHQFRFSNSAPGSHALPNRIEYHPRAWLRLTLEAVPERGNS